ncbi:MAG: tetratricopeptide repeat protein [Blastocatellia bacterium]|nr:tetratricopeptide repeat protein [Blastocatellia bacterium]
MKLCRCHLAIWMCLSLFTGPALGQNHSLDESIKLGAEAKKQKQWSQAEQYFETAVQLSEKLKDGDTRKVVALTQLALVEQEQTKQDEAETHATQAVLALNKCRKANKPRGQGEEFLQIQVSFRVYKDMGYIFFANQKYPEAEKLYQQAVSILQDVARPVTNPQSNDDFIQFLAQEISGIEVELADLYGNLGQVQLRQQRLKKAQEMYSKALEIKERKLGKTHPDTAILTLNLAIVHAMQKQYDKAGPLFQQAVTTLEQTHLTNRPVLVQAYANYARFLEESGLHTEAEHVLAKAREIQKNLR